MHTNLVDSFPTAAGEELLQQHIEYRRRSGMLLRISAEDVARMVTDFAAARSRITTYPPTRAAPSQQNRIKPLMARKTSRRLGSESTMNMFHRALAYLFRGKPTGPLVLGWSYQNGQRAVFRLPH